MKFTNLTQKKKKDIPNCGSGALISFSFAFVAGSVEIEIVTFMGIMSSLVLFAYDIAQLSVEKNEILAKKKEEEMNGPIKCRHRQ